MRFLSLLPLLYVLSLAAPVAGAQAAADARGSEYVRLLHATRYVEHLKEIAAVTTRVSSVRNQNGGEEYARLMNLVAWANRSGIDSCLVTLYQRHDLTRRDAADLAAIFESPLGMKLVDQSIRSMAAAVEQGREQPIAPSAFSIEEIRRIAELRQNLAFRKYGLMTSSEVFASGAAKCIAGSLAAQKPALAR